MNVNEITEFMESKGLPYYASNPGQLVSMIASAGSKYPVVAVVKENEMLTHTFVGYYDKDEAVELAAHIGRLRKVEVIYSEVLVKV